MNMIGYPLYWYKVTTQKNNKEIPTIVSRGEKWQGIILVNAKNSEIAIKKQNIYICNIINSGLL